MTMREMTANDNKCYLSYLNKLVDQCNNTYHSSIDTKPIDANYFALTEDIESSQTTSKFKVGERVRITKYMNIFSKGGTEIWSREIFVINSVLKTNPFPCKIKDLNG